MTTTSTTTLTAGTPVSNDLKHKAESACACYGSLRVLVLLDTRVVRDSSKNEDFRTHDSLVMAEQR